MLAMNDSGSTHQTIYSRIAQFLGHEAMLLDENRLDEWVALLDEAMIYQVPIRLADMRGGKNEFPQHAYRIQDDLSMIKKRIERVATGEAWAENPPSRTVRLVGSITVDPTDQADIYSVASATLVYRQRGQDDVADLIPARRRDRIRATDTGCTLLQRTVILAQTVIQTPNLGIFF